MNIASTDRMKEIDRHTIKNKGFSEFILMENAGIRIIEEFLKNDSVKKKTIICVAGKGNNGGDALVIARQLFSFYNANVIIVSIAREGSEAFNFNYKICKNLGIDITCLEDQSSDMLFIKKIFSSASIIFDGLAGTGLKGELKGKYLRAVELINESTAKKVSIDIPSGAGEDYQAEMAAVTADLTITVGLPKRCLYYPAVRPKCGKIKIAKIGFPDDLLDDRNLEADQQDWKLADFSLIKKNMPVFREDAYKNTRGHLAIFAGNKGTIGAASLAVKAATRTAAGLVSLFVYDEIYSILAAREGASIMVKPVEDLSQRELPKYDAVAAGPGWGRERLDLIKNLIEFTSKGVLDADALNLLASMNEYPNLRGRWVLTPHIGEFKRLFPDLDPHKDPFIAASTAAKRINAVIVLKGAVSFIASPENKGWVVDGVYPKLATAGSGDVLCGIIAGYLASGLEPFRAAVLGCLLHLKAAKKCGKNIEWFNAEDILTYL